MGAAHSGENEQITQLLETLIRAVTRVEAAVLVSSKSEKKQPETNQQERNATVQAFQAGNWSVSINNTPTVQAEQAGIWEFTPSDDAQPAKYMPVRRTYGTYYMDHPPNFIPIDITSPGRYLLVDAQTDKRIRATTLCLTAGTNLYARFETGDPGTAITGRLILNTNCPICAASDLGLFETNPNEPLYLLVEASLSVPNGDPILSGWLTWIGV